MLTLIMYILTAVISIVIAVLLTRLAKLSNHAGVKADKKSEDSQYRSISSGGHLIEAVSEQLAELPDSAGRRKISERIADFFDKELQRQISRNNEELSKKYDTLLDQERKNEEIAWNKYKKALTDKKETEAVIHSIAEGLVVVGSDGKIIMMNPAAEKLLGVSKKDKIGKPLLDDVKEEQLFSLVKSSDKPEDREIELASRQDETKKILRASSAVIENENGKTIGMVSVLSDVTKQRELDRLKSNFVATVSHELRTPLVAITKSIAMILDKTTGAVSEKQEQVLSIAQRNLKRLSVLINDLLDLSKLEAGRMQINRSPAAIEKIIDESVEGLNTWAKTKSITVEKKIQSGLPQVNVDPDKIIQVLNNLIGNSIKFTPAGGRIIIEAALDSMEGCVTVNVADTGIGIAEEDLPKIFDKFYQVGERVSSDISGTGIGLSIAKEIVELHGGKIRVESQKASGAKFIFTLPAYAG